MYYFTIHNRILKYAITKHLINVHNQIHISTEPFFNIHKGCQNRTLYICNDKKGTVSPKLDTCVPIKGRFIVFNQTIY